VFCLCKFGGNSCLSDVDGCFVLSVASFWYGQASVQPASAYLSTRVGVVGTRKNRLSLNCYIFLACHGNCTGELLTQE